MHEVAVVEARLPINEIHGVEVNIRSERQWDEPHGDFKVEELPVMGM